MVGVLFTALYVTSQLLVISQLSWWSSYAFTMCVFCFLDHLSSAHGPTASSWQHSLADPNAPTSYPGNTKLHFVISFLACLFSFHGGYSDLYYTYIHIYMFFLCVFFFRALSQDDQDDIHLKLEDIIQLVSLVMVLSSTIMCKLPLKCKQYACNW